MSSRVNRGEYSKRSSRQAPTTSHGWRVGPPGPPKVRRASQGGQGPCPEGDAAMDGREFAQAQDAPSSANPWTTEKRREPRARRARGGPPGVCWRCRRPCTSKVSCSGRGSGPKRFVPCQKKQALGSGTTQAKKPMQRSGGPRPALRLVTRRRSRAAERAPLYKSTSKITSSGACSALRELEHPRSRRCRTGARPPLRRHPRRTGTTLNPRPSPAACPPPAPRSAPRSCADRRGPPRRAGRSVACR